MKKFLAVVLCMAVALTLTGCGDFKYDKEDKQILAEYVGKGGDVVIPEGITEVGARSFRNCESLTSVVIPDGVTFISTSAFSGCTNLKSVTIPSSVDRISSSVFYGCTSLESIVIPEGVTRIYSMAFAECTNLTEIKLPSTIEAFDINVFLNTPWLENKRKENPLVVVNNILVDGETCFGDVVIPNGVTSIEKCAFSGCESIESVTVPDGVTRIGWYAFGDCPNLKSVILPDSASNVDYDAFQGSKNVSITYKGRTYSYDELDDFREATYK